MGSISDGVTNSMGYYMQTLKINDRPGCIPVAQMRHYFEGAINSTPVLKASRPLDVVTSAGEFQHYADPGTDSMWTGFALGMRAAERIHGATGRRAHVSAAAVASTTDSVVSQRPAKPFQSAR